MIDIAIFKLRHRRNNSLHQSIVIFFAKLASVAVRIKGESWCFSL